MGGKPRRSPTGALFVRKWILLTILQWRTWTTAELAELFEVSKSTIERELRDLALLYRVNSAQLGEQKRGHSINRRRNHSGLASPAFLPRPTLTAAERAILARARCY